MDDLNHQFGQLSTDAAEWRPSPSAAGSSSQRQATDFQEDRYNMVTSNATASSLSLSLSPYRSTQVGPFQQGATTTTTTTTTGGSLKPAPPPAATLPQSDLSAQSVKEFVPGRGWNGGSGNSGSASNAMNLTAAPVGNAGNRHVGGSGTPTLSTPVRSSHTVLLPPGGPLLPGHATSYSSPPTPIGQIPSAGSVASDPGGATGVGSVTPIGAVPTLLTMSMGPGGGPPLPPVMINGVVGCGVGTGSPPAVPPSFRGLHSLGVPEDAWRHYRDMSLEARRQMDPADHRHNAVPLPYCNAYCLDDDPNRDVVAGSGGTARRSSFGYPASTFQVTNREDGNLYCLRRFDGVRSVSPKIAATVLDRWRAAPPAVRDHPGVVPLHRCFCANRAVFFVHGFVPGGAETLRERLLRRGPVLSEPVLWSCLAQLVSALRAVHASQLAARSSLAPNHVLSTGTGGTTGTGGLRLRLACCGVSDALEFEARKPMADLQRADVRNLGRLLLGLATGTEIPPCSSSSCSSSSPSSSSSCSGDTRHHHHHHQQQQQQHDETTLQRCEAYLSQHFSRELHNLIMTLIRSQPRPPSIVEVCRAVSLRCLDEQDAAHGRCDRLERQLSAEYESGRVCRLLLKLGFVNERPEFARNRRWSQSGDCYLLSLFRDFVFHQADGAGNPVMDLGHVVTALNKLDAADPEKIVLASRDGKSIMVVSYADVAACLENAYRELCDGSVAPPLSSSAPRHARHPQRQHPY